MGRHRTARARMKKITSPATHLEKKRNRQMKLKEQRKVYRKKKGEQIKRDQETIRALDEKLGLTATGKSNENPIIKGVSEKFLERVQHAQDTFGAMDNILDDVQGVLYVLDARDPIGCRCVDLEEENEKQGKKVAFALTSIDKVPKEVVQQWLTALNQEKPTVAFGYPPNKDLVEQFITETFPETEAIAVLGAPKIGKTSIAEVNPDKLKDTPGWGWTNCGMALSLINSLEWKGRMRELIADTLERMKNEVIFTKLGVPKRESVGDFFNEVARKQEIGKKDVPNWLFDQLKEGKIPWLATPSEIEPMEFSPLQQTVLETALQQSADGFVLIDSAKPVTPDMSALSFEMSDYSDTEEEEEEEEE